MPQDDEEAVYWWSKAAEQGCVPAMHNMGYCYVNGIGVDRDEELAADWLFKAADEGYEDSIELLRLMGYNV